MHINALKTRLFHEHDHLVAFLREHTDSIQEADIIVVTSKIVALSEGRTADRSEKEKLMRAESSWVVPARSAWIALKDHLFMAFAGIDESNADGRLILLPRNSFQTATALREELAQIYGVRQLGVLITDSRVEPLRAGVTGVALGYAGFRGIRDYRGSADLFGRTLQMTRTNVADCLASAAVLAMGEGPEQTPLAIIRGAPVAFTPEAIDPLELVVPPEADLYAPLLNLPSQPKPTTHD